MTDLFSMQMSAQQVNSISNVGLAHIGDGVYELMCRSWLCIRGDKTVLKLHRDTVELVQASHQAKLVEALLPMLTQAEQDYYRRGKNAHTRPHPRAATAKQYAMATGLECLFGALYLQGQTQRLNELFYAGMEALYGI